MIFQNGSHTHPWLEPVLRNNTRPEPVRRGAVRQPPVRPELAGKNLPGRPPEGEDHVDEAPAAVRVRVEEVQDKLMSPQVEVMIKTKGGWLRM